MQLIPLAISAGATYFANRASKANPTANEQGVINNAQQAQTAGTQGGTSLLNQGQAATQGPMNYWASILSGNKAGITSALGPELFNIQQGYQRAGQTSAALNPRGGPSSSFLAEQPWSQAHDVSSLFQQARPQAASSLFSSGNSLLSQGAGLLNASTAAGRTIMDSEQNRRLLEQQRSTAMGKGIFDLMQKYGPQLSTMLKGSGNKGGGLLGGGLPEEDPT